MDAAGERAQLRPGTTPTRPEGAVPATDTCRTLETASRARVASSPPGPLGLGAIVRLIYCSVSGRTHCGLEGVVGEGAGMGLLLILSSRSSSVCRRLC